MTGYTVNDLLSKEWVKIPQHTWCLNYGEVLFCGYCIWDFLPPSADKTGILDTAREEWRNGDVGIHVIACARFSLGMMLRALPLWPRIKLLFLAPRIRSKLRRENELIALYGSAKDAILSQHSLNT